MTFTSKTILCFGSLWLLTAPLSAESVTNQELLEACEDKGPAAQNFCYGFIISTANAAQYYRNIMDTEGAYIDICFPDTLSNEELVKDYIAWMKKNPTLTNDPAFIGASTSFSSRYSCPEKK